MLIKPTMLLAAGTLILICFSISFAKSKDKPVLKINIKTDEPLFFDKELKALSTQMEELAITYDTTNKKDYWESESKESVLKLLNSYGYFAAEIESEIGSDNQNVLTLHVYPNQRYKISNVSIEYDPESNKSVPLPPIKNFGLKEGDDVIALKIKSIQQDLFDHIEENNCLLNLSVFHEAIIDHTQNSVEIIYFINAGQNAKIKSVSFEGLESINPDYVRKIVKIKDGICFKQSIIEEAKLKLQKSGLFASTKPIIPTSVDQDGRVPIIFKVKERHHRSLTAGVHYSVDLGIGAAFGWKHRNFNSGGEELSSNIIASRKEQIFDTNYTIPFFMRDDQTLRIGGGVKNAKNKAFDSRQYSIYSSIERKLFDIYTIGIGGKGSFDEIKVDNVQKNSILLSLPLFSSRDTRDNILDPHHGNFIKAELAPSLNIKQNKTSFIKGSILGSAYLSLDNEEDMLVAFKGKIGSIMGVRSSRIPATERYYAGGINSVRGYDAKLAGDLVNKRPVGGRALFETTIELRKKIKDNIGAVLFLDSGNSYDSLTPKLKKKLYHGLGAGIRYHTGFGPLRADIAIPLKRRKRIDRPYQFYIGIGQSF